MLSGHGPSAAPRLAVLAGAAAAGRPPTPRDTSITGRNSPGREPGRERGRERGWPPTVPCPCCHSRPRRRPPVGDLVFVLLTIAAFALLGLAVRAVEKL
ncbi:hypothetical protein ABZS66_41315 [Dactylosporangium sp. NPDC005572]|uniref:hypothetical protein n=1 Tax=Dactylosporangium sp. NPDC005572 TaxID=3156889 RepID=UPI0033BA4229